MSLLSLWILDDHETCASIRIWNIIRDVAIALQYCFYTSFGFIIKNIS